MRAAFYAGYDESDREYVQIGSAGRRIAEGRKLVSTTFVVPYPPGFPVLVPGQVVSKEILYFLAQLDVKEIHGYNPELGLSVFTPEALDRLEAQRSAAIAAVGTPFPAFELPLDTSVLNGAEMASAPRKPSPRTSDWVSCSGSGGRRSGSRGLIVLPASERQLGRLSA